MSPVPERIHSLRKSFHYAFRGIAFCVKNERNMRIHVVAGTYVLCFSPFFHLSAAEYAVLFVTIAMVMAAEAFNTAIEAGINLETQGYDHLARIGKDVAAGAVLISACFAVAVGLVLFLRSAVLLGILLYLITHPFWGIVAVLSVPAALVFVFAFPFTRPR